MASEVREMVRRALLVALGVLLVFPTAFGMVIVSDGGFIWLLGIAGAAVVVFFVGRALINWIFLK